MADLTVIERMNKAREFRSEWGYPRGLVIFLGTRLPGGSATLRANAHTCPTALQLMRAVASGWPLVATTTTALIAGRRPMADAWGWICPGDTGITSACSSKSVVDSLAAQHDLVVVPLVRDREYPACR